MAEQRRRSHPHGAQTADLLALHLPLIRRVCHAHLSGPTDVEDAVQETCVQFLQADLQRIRNVEAWLVRVSGRVCGHIHRWRFLHPEAELSEQTRTCVDDSALTDTLNYLWFHKIVSQLSQLDRDALTLLYVHELPRESIADSLGISMDHLRVVLCRARRRTQRLISAYDDGVSL